MFGFWGPNNGGSRKIIALRIFFDIEELVIIPVIKDMPVIGSLHFRNQGTG